jgi:hypothetical protein
VDFMDWTQATHLQRSMRERVLRGNASDRVSWSDSHGQLQKDVCDSPYNPPAVGGRVRTVLNLFSKHSNLHTLCTGETACGFYGLDTGNAFAAVNARASAERERQ